MRERKNEKLYSGKTELEYLVEEKERRMVEGSEKFGAILLPSYIVSRRWPTKFLRSDIPFSFSFFFLFLLFFLVLFLLLPLLEREEKGGETIFDAPFVVTVIHLPPSPSLSLPFFSLKILDLGYLLIDYIRKFSKEDR